MTVLSLLSLLSRLHHFLTENSLLGARVGEGSLVGVGVNVTVKVAFKVAVKVTANVTVKVAAEVTAKVATCIS